MPFPSTLQAIREFRHQMLLEEAEQEHRAAFAVRPCVSKGAFMFGEGNDWMIQRGVDEVLSCRDMLTPTPQQPSQIARLRAYLADLMRSIAPQKSARKQHAERPMLTSENPQVARHPTG